MKNTSTRKQSVTDIRNVRSSRWSIQREKIQSLQNWSIRHGWAVNVTARGIFRRRNEEIQVRSQLPRNVIHGEHLPLGPAETLPDYVRVVRVAAAAQCTLDVISVRDRVAVSLVRTILSVDDLAIESRTCTTEKPLPRDRRDGREINREEAIGSESALRRPNLKKW